MRKKQVIYVPSSLAGQSPGYTHTQNNTLDKRKIEGKIRNGCHKIRKYISVCK